MVMRIPRAELVPDTLLPCGVGTRGAHTAILRTEGGLRRAYVKPLSPDGVAAECFCALLLKAWGLDVPDPMVVDIEASRWFASADVGYPDLRRRFAIEPSRTDPATQARIIAAARVVCGFAAAPLALACDEAIGNGDRNLENVLWDGGSEPLWIDHERTLGLPGSSDANKLADLACAIGLETSMQRSAIAQSLAFAPDALDAVSEAMPNAGLFVAFVRNRMSGLQARILNRFPTPSHDLFAGR